MTFSATSGACSRRSANLSPSHNGSKKLRLTALLSSAILTLSGCDSPTAPRPDGATELAHDVLFYDVTFAEHWATVEACSGLRGDHRTVRIFSVPGDRGIMLDGRFVAGYYDSRRHHIYISHAYITARVAWRHEALHALLRAAGHPRRYFVERCGSLVAWDAGA